MSDRDQVKAATSAAARRAAVQWLERHGLGRQGETTVEHLRRLAQFREQLKEAKAPSARAWALDVVARYRAGEPVEYQAVAMAFEQLGISEPILRSVQAPRPDLRDLQAGDTTMDGF